jgi:hypothetical protein
MKSFLITSISLVFMCIQQLHAEPLRGASLIGMCSKNFECGRIEEVLRSTPPWQPVVFGYLAETFGRKCKCLDRLLDLPHKKIIRVHIANGTCFPERGRRCNRLDVFSGLSQREAETLLNRNNRRLMRRFRMAVHRVHERLSGRQDAIIYWSSTLESPFRKRARKRLLEALRGIVGDENLVDSVLKQRCLSNTVCERHGDRFSFEEGQRCIVDTDGIPMSSINQSSFLRGSIDCELAFYWTNGFNLLEGNRFTDPLKRKGRISQGELWTLGLLLGLDYSSL